MMTQLLTQYVTSGFRERNIWLTFYFNTQNVPADFDQGLTGDGRGQWKTPLMA